MKRPSKVWFSCVYVVVFKLLSWASLREFVLIIPVELSFSFIAVNKCPKYINQLRYAE
jgi:hypothetical protein